MHKGFSMLVSAYGAKITGICAFSNFKQRLKSGFSSHLKLRLRFRRSYFSCRSFFIPFRGQNDTQSVLWKASISRFRTHWAPLLLNLNESIFFPQCSNLIQIGQAFLEDLSSLISGRNWFQFCSLNRFNGSISGRSRFYWSSALLLRKEFRGMSLKQIVRAFYRGPGSR